MTSKLILIPETGESHSVQGMVSSFEKIDFVIQLNNEGNVGTTAHISINQIKRNFSPCSMYGVTYPPVACYD